MVIDMTDYLDSIGQEIRVGDIIKYTTYNKYGVVEELRDQQLVVFKCEFGREGSYNTYNGKWQQGAEYILSEPKLQIKKKAFISNINDCLVITSLDLTKVKNESDLNVFAELRRRSNELLRDQL